MKIVYIDKEKEVLRRLDNIKVDVAKECFFPVYVVHLKDDNGWSIEYKVFMTRWGVNRFIKNITKKKEKFDRSRMESRIKNTDI